LKTAVVILNWNGEGFLRQFLPTVVAHSADAQAEVVVADNGSTDGSVAFVRQALPQVRLVLLHQNYGFTGGYNRALASVDTDYAVLLNSDVSVPQGWLQPLVDYMDAHPDTAACMPKILSFAQPTRFEYAGAAGGFIDLLGYPFCRGRMLGTLENDRGQYNDTREIFWATGACMLVRTALYKDLGGLDNDFFAHMEEIDLCWRMKNAGHKIAYVGSSHVLHVGGGTLPNNNPRKMFFNYRNNLLMLHKNLSPRLHLPVLTLRFVLDWASALAFAMQFRMTFAAAVFKAHRAFFALKKGKRHAAQTQSLRRLTGVYCGSIVAAYFLRRRKTFNLLTKL
jgi:GT2 family glycosyltransferase